MGRRGQKAVAERFESWPAHSPGAVNAWLLLVTTKEPAWRDPLVGWEESPLTFGSPHQGFFYPDPLGFWAEVRAWALELLRLRQPGWTVSDALSVSALVHVGDHPERTTRAVEAFSPGLVLFLDESSWERSGLTVTPTLHHIPDPHRPGHVYEGFWGRTAQGAVVGKSPQHPTTHNLYRADDMLEFLRSAPVEP